MPLLRACVRHFFYGAGLVSEKAAGRIQNHTSGAGEHETYSNVWESGKGMKHYEFTEQFYKGFREIWD